MSKVISCELLVNIDKVTGERPKPLVALIETNPMAEKDPRENLQILFKIFSTFKQNLKKK